MCNVLLFAFYYSCMTLLFVAQSHQKQLAKPYVSTSYTLFFTWLELGLKQQFITGGKQSPVVLWCLCHTDCYCFVIFFFFHRLVNQMTTQFLALSSPSICNIIQTEWMKIYKWRLTISTQNNVCSQCQVPPQAKNTITFGQYIP